MARPSDASFYPEAVVGQVPDITAIKLVVTLLADAGQASSPFNFNASMIKAPER